MRHSLKAITIAQSIGLLEGTAKVTIDDNVQLVSEGQSVYVPLGAKHRMENLDSANGLN